MMTTFTHACISLDRTVFHAINTGMACNTLDLIMPVITQLGLGGVQACTVLFLAIILGCRDGIFVSAPGVWAGIKLSIYNKRSWVGPLLVCIIISGITSQVIKFNVSRQRPWWFYNQEHIAGRQIGYNARIVPGVRPLKVYGFPSGHTATSFAMATASTILFGIKRKYRWYVLGAWVVAGLIGFSRIYIAMHWPLDVLGGILLGILSGVVSVKICSACAKRKLSQTKGTV